MLVLGRKKNESIAINNDVIVTVVDIKGDKVRLGLVGIVAPPHVSVHRQEVSDARHFLQPPFQPTSPDGWVLRIVHEEAACLVEWTWTTLGEEESPRGETLPGHYP